MIDILIGVLCEVRGPAHYDQHGGLAADSAYHVSHGERPTCTGDAEPAKAQREDGDGPGVWRRDRIGFNCTWHGCG